MPQAQTPFSTVFLSSAARTIVVPLTVLIVGLLTAPHIQAATATPSATTRPTASPTATVRPRPATAQAPKATATPEPTATPTPQPTAPALRESTVKLRERLQRILGDADDADSVKIGGYIGEITRVSEEALTLKTLTSSEIIPLSGVLKLMRRNQPISVSDLSVGNWVIVIGERGKSNAITPEIIMVQTASLKPRESLVTIGLIQEVTKTGVTIVPRGKTDQITLAFTKNSKLLDTDGDNIAQNKLPKDISAVIVGYATPNGWELGTLKSTVRMEEIKNPATPTPTPTLRPVRSVTPRATAKPASGSAQ